MHSVFRAFAAAVVVSTLASGAHAQQYGTAPSMVPVGKTVAVSGGGVVAGSVVSIRLTSPNGVVTVFATVANAQGKFSQGLTAAAAGMHRIELLDANNQRFADMRMMASQAN